MYTYSLSIYTVVYYTVGKLFWSTVKITKCVRKFEPAPGTVYLLPDRWSCNLVITYTIS